MCEPRMGELEDKPHILHITFAGTLDVFKSLSPTGERKPNSSLAQVQEDQRRLLKMWLSNDDTTLEDKLYLQQIHLLGSRIAKPETPLGVEACTRCYVLKELV